MDKKSKIKIGIGKQRAGSVAAKIRSKPIIVDHSQRQDIKVKELKSENDSLKQEILNMKIKLENK